MKYLNLFVVAIAILVMSSGPLVAQDSVVADTVAPDSIALDTIASDSVDSDSIVADTAIAVGEINTDSVKIHTQIDSVYEAAKSSFLKLRGCQAIFWKCDHF